MSTAPSNPSNPFAALDKSRFRKVDDTAGGTNAKARRAPPKVKLIHGSDPATPEDEAALFLNAVGSVRSLNNNAAPEAEQEIFDPDAISAKAEHPIRPGTVGLNRIDLPRKKRGRPEPDRTDLADITDITGNAGITDNKNVTADTAKSSQIGDTGLSSEFAKLVGLTLPKSHDDKRVAMFREAQQERGRELPHKQYDPVREIPQERREQARERSRNAVIAAKEHETDARLARLADPEADTESLFLDAMGAVAPLLGKGRDVTPAVPVPDLPVQPEGNPMQDFMDGKLAFALASTDEYVEGHVVGLDLLLVSKLQNGQFSPEGHVDLHGLNTVGAFQTLVGFMRGAYMKGHRTVLVVPGRGKNSPLGMGVLREKVQEWFTQEPFRRVVLAFCTAKSSDGGAGAMYVLLRKYKKTNGKVYWDRTPIDPDLTLSDC